jgi:hypothetical protein
MEEFQVIQDEQGHKQSPKRSSFFDGVKQFVDDLTS